jgi:hypothetical protein
MDSVTLMRIAGLAVTIVIFIVTVLLMPRIFGVNEPVEVEGLGARPAPPAPAGAAATPAGGRQAGSGAAAPAVTPGKS